MEYRKKYYKENGYTPNLVSKYFVRFVRSGHFDLVFILFCESGSKIFGYVLISCVCNQCFEVVAENVVVVRFLKFFYHGKHVPMHSYFDAVVFDKFYGVEEGIFNLLSA